jgi:hypothetical protein
MDYTLSIANIEFLKKEISKSGLTFSHLRDDLIDHVCCDVEYEMRNGLSFGKAYDLVIEKIGIGGLERIQHETLYLIDKKYRIMKKTMKISGVIAPILMAFGALFKIQHWPYASILLVLGFFLLSFVFLPSAIYVSYKEVSNRTKKWTHFLGFIGTFFLSLSFLFKVMHWPGTNIAMCLGIVIICLIFLPLVLINKLRDDEVPLPKYVFALAMIGMIIFLTAFLFKMMHWSGAPVFMFTGTVLLVFVAFPIYVLKTYRERVHIANSYIFISVAIIWLVVPLTLMSLNVSPPVLKAAYETSNYTDTDLKFIKERNNMLLDELKEDHKAIAIKNSANELLAFIQNIKVEMVKLAGRESAILDNNEIMTSRIEGDCPLGLYNIVLFDKDQRDVRLKELLRKFEQEALAVSTNFEYSSVIRKTVGYPISPEDNPKDVLLISLNKLSFLQLNICLAEQTALIQVRHQMQSSINQ